MWKAFLFVSLILLVSCTTTTAPPVTQVEPPKTPDQTSVSKVFVVSQEKKASSLAEIRLFIDKLNAIIAKKAFSEWKTYLDEGYLTVFDDPVRLKAYSDSSPVLKKYKVRLKTLEDYFQFVVVPSRADGKDVVDDITFVDENRVEVWTVVDNERLLLYLLKLYGKEWKISSW